jgi:hypothetical protein
MATPTPPSGNGSSMSYRKRRTKTLPPMAVAATRRTTTKSHDQPPLRPARRRPRVRPGAAETSTHHNAGEVFRGARCRTLLPIVDGLFEVVPGILSGTGLRHFGERRLGKAVQKLPWVPLTRKLDVPPRGVRRR